MLMLAPRGASMTKDLEKGRRLTGVLALEVHTVVTEAMVEHSYPTISSRANASLLTPNHITLGMKLDSRGLEEPVETNS
jgi:hypothetical protein